MRARTLLLSAGAAVAVLAGVLIVAVNRIEPADYLAVAAARVKEITGRELKVDGRVGFTVSLVPTVSLEGVRFQNAPWGSRPDMLTAARLEVEIALLPLVAGKVDIRGLTLVEPDLLLETNAAGEGNWTFARAGSKEQATPPAEESGQAVDIRRARIEKGTLSYRDAQGKSTHRLEIETLAAKTSGSRTEAELEARLNGQPVQATALVDRGAAPPSVAIAAKAAGVALDAKLSTAKDKDKGPSGRLELTVSDWSGVARLAGMAAPPRLPPLQASGDLRSERDTWILEGMKAALGKSSFTGTLSVKTGKDAPVVDLKMASPFVDLAELRGPPDKKPPKDGRLFSADPLPLEALKDLTGRIEARIARLGLKDGKSVEDVEFQASADRGRINADPVRLRIENRELRVRASVDASSGKSMALDLNVEGTGISLGALGALLDLTGTPEGSPTDVSIRFAGRGASVRALMADANGDVRIVVGPGRLKNRAIEWGADVTELMNALNPTRTAEPYTELKCAVIRLPIRQGVARIDNSIAMETARVNVMAAGIVDLRNEALDLGFRPKAATGLGVGLGSLASLARLRGSFAAPKVELDMGGTAQAATQLGLAAATGGLSLLAGGLLAERMPDKPCQTALTGAAPRAPDRPAEKPGVVDSVVGGFKKLFGR